MTATKHRIELAGAVATGGGGHGDGLPHPLDTTCRGNGA
jgi:hypothetical protein